ncbi:unnamed protein product [Paramecium octaurelia]|uniref:Uncharacterized protein n=1 Tax=Paramecium octaurelia TaxID=43137 RepID=A0A8S1WG16_PAROT|nr:unnamed protein product [Paramecium octaurelia]CAD8181399.1 unnamed protein product [Paramecium octaurelia]CAD8187662.1 unnamed protein product [Paramecium octaurelia]
MCGTQPQNIFMGPYGYQTTVTKTFTNVPQIIELNFRLVFGNQKGFEIYANDVQIENLKLNLRD